MDRAQTNLVLFAATTQLQQQPADHQSTGGTSKRDQIFYTTFGDLSRNFRRSVKTTHASGLTPVEARRRSLSLHRGLARNHSRNTWLCRAVIARLSRNYTVVTGGFAAASVTANTAGARSWSFAGFGADGLRRAFSRRGSLFSRCGLGGRRLFCGGFNRLSGRLILHRLIHYGIVHYRVVLGRRRSFLSRRLNDIITGLWLLGRSGLNSRFGINRSFRLVDRRARLRLS